METTTFSFNKIIFIESINISKHPRLAIGDKLIHDLENKILSIQSTTNALNGLSCKLIKVNGCDDFEKVCSQIATDCENGCRPIIHFICHGYYNKSTNVSFMWLSSPTSAAGYEPISWSCVSHCLEKINVACHNNLLVTMCVCHGLLSIADLLDEGHRIPFWCLLSKSTSVSLNEGLKMLDFYLELIQTLSLNEAITHFKCLAYNSSTPVENQLSPTFSDAIFTHVLRTEFQKRLDNTYLENKAKEFWGSLGISVPTQLHIGLYKNIYQKDISEIYCHLRDFKFMFDIYPEERKRFILPETYDELMKLNTNSSRKEQPSE